MPRSKRKMTDLMPESTNIPVRNVWHMLLYAWSMADFVGRFDGNIEDAPDLHALATKLLAYLMKRQVRRGLRGDYVDRSESLKTVRGRIDFPGTISEMTLIKGELLCEYQEHTLNVPKNQIVATTLRRELRGGAFTEGRLRPEDQNTATRDVRALLRMMEEIDRVRLTSRLIRDESRKLGTNDREYKLMLLICDWLLTRRMPGEREGHTNLVDWAEFRKSTLFERFVAGFYLQHLGMDWSVNPQSERDWYAPTDPSFRLPKMQRDVVLKRKSEPSQLIVVETKRTRKVLDRRDGSKPAVRSDHLYQIYSYLASQVHSGHPYDEATGILLYAQPAGESVAFRTRIDAHPFWVHTLDLSQHWQKIESDLLNLIEETTT